MNLNLGSGTDRFKGWLNFDADPRAKPDYIGNVDDLSMFKTGSVNAIFASHILEHIPFGKDVIVEWKRVLKVGGTLIVVVPDLGQLTALYDAGIITELYLQATVYGPQVLGDNKEFMTHYRIYTPLSLARCIGQHFPNVIIGAPELMPRTLYHGETVVCAVKRKEVRGGK